MSHCVVRKDSNQIPAIIQKGFLHEINKGLVSKCTSTSILTKPYIYKQRHENLSILLDVFF